MKKILKIVSLLSTLFLAVNTVTACVNTNGGEQAPEIVATEGYVGKGTHEATVTNASGYFIQNGKTDYTIVIPKDAKKYELQAAELINQYTALATGATYPVVTDENLKANGKYISIGETTLLHESGIAIPFSRYKRSGFRCYTEGNVLYLAGARSNLRKGTLYAAQEFLKYTIGFKAYSIDEIKYNKLSSVRAFNFDVVEIPEFDDRRYGVGTIVRNDEHVNLLRMDVKGEGEIPFSGHSHFTVLPPEIYFDEHPDWYWYKTEGATEYDSLEDMFINGQLCLSNQEMIAEFCNQIVEWFRKYPDADFVHLGMQDSQTGCQCKNCKAKIAQYNTNFSGLNIMFMNQVARTVEAEIQRTEPERELTFECFAYFTTLIPPADEVNGVWKEHCAEVVPDQNVMIQFAPLGYNTSEVLDSNYPNECPTFGRSDYRESMLAFDFDGVRVGDLEYVGHTILAQKPELDGMPSVRGGQTLVVRLFDKVHNATVLLYYTVFEELPVILRHTEIVNEGEKLFKLDRAYSFAVDYPQKQWEAVRLYGAHGRERMVERSKLSQGIFTIDSKRGVSSSQMNPFLALVCKNTDEESGEAYGYNLVYGGNFVFKAEIGESDGLRLVGGINDYDFSWTLAAGERFVTPEVVMVYSDGGLGKMSRVFHDLYREYLIDKKHAKSTRPIVINHWEATRFTFTTEKLCAFIDSVKGTGIDTFVLDDGWFGGKGPRDNELRGLGDWEVAEEKIDLKALIRYAHEAGLKFGIWFEPEMVNRDSELFRAHPEYVLQAKGVEPCEGRWQYVLDLTQKEVRDYLVSSVSNILNDYEIDYVKWDMNRALTDFGSVFDKETAHRYVLGLYDILQRLVYGFPNVFFEGCASGGCRFDPAMLYYFPQIWTSDNTDAYMRSCIQYGTSFCYPLSAASCHVSKSPNQQCGRITSLATRGNIARLGAFGYELDTSSLSKEEIQEVKAQVQEYKREEELILNGDLYRLNSPFEGNLFAVEVVSKDKKKATLTVMKPISVHNDDTLRIYPKGLNEGDRYEVKELGLIRSGATLMGVGLSVNLPKRDFESVVYHFNVIEE
ncbi:MAG: DUF4838 domain-containing protein [Clostridia bacterium]|nr:DUF4838 domain-containing protein [Clostridia bacterium]